MHTCNQDQDTAHVATTCNPHVTSAAGGSAAVQSKFRRCVHTSRRSHRSQAKAWIEGWASGSTLRRVTSLGSRRNGDHHQYHIIAYPCYDEA